MISKSSWKSARCIGRSRSSASWRPASRVGEDHLAHHGDAGGVEEHVLGAAEAEAVDAEVAGHPRLGGGVGVGADPEVADRVGPVEQLGERAAELGGDHRRRAGDHLAAGAVERDARAFAEDAAVGAGQDAVVRVEAELAGADDARQPDAAGDDGGVAGHAAAHGQDAAGGVHAADVLGAGLEAGEDRRLVLGGGGLGGLGGEDEAPGGGAGAGGEAGGEDVARRGRVDLRVQVLDQAARVDAQERLGAGDRAGVGEVDGDADGGAGGAADRGGVEDREAAVLERELEPVGVAEARRWPGRPSEAPLGPRARGSRAAAACRRRPGPGGGSRRRPRGRRFGWRRAGAGRSR